MNDIESIYLQLLNQYPFIFRSEESINSKLSIAIALYYSFLSMIEQKEKSFKVYPVSMSNEELTKIYNQEFKKLVEESIRSGIPIENLMNDRIEELNCLQEENKKYAKETPMEPYYGCPKFMFGRASYILECIEKLSIEEFHVESFFQRMQQFMEKYGHCKNNWGDTIYPFYDEEYKKDYHQFEKDYYGILEIEKALVPTVEKVWKEKLTIPEKHNDQDFSYLIHVFTNGMIPLENMGKVCCSYATPNLLTTPYGNCGIICDYDKDAVEVLCTEDAGSWLSSKDEFIDRGFPITWQISNPVGVSVWYEYEQISKLILPDDLEREAIQKNIRLNGEPLNFSRMSYSEIFLNSNAKAIGAFYTDDCKDITAIQAYATKYQLPLIHLSLQKLRENAGLPPIQKEEENHRQY